MAVIKLREHQEDVVKFSIQNGYLGALIWHGMGLGKTLSSLTIARLVMSSLRNKGIARNPKTLVIMPKSAVTTWRFEGQDKTPDIYNDIVLLPYSQMHRSASLIMYYDIRVIIFDESHYLKSPETNRAQVLKELLLKIADGPGKFAGGKLLLLSGTPMLNNASELYTSWALCASQNLYEAAERLVDESRFQLWTKTFSLQKENTWFSKKEGREKRGSDYEGVNNSDKLTVLMSPVTHYRRVSDCIDLPEKQEIPIDLNLPDDKLLADADIEAPEAYMALLERLSVAKTPHLLEWVREYLSACDKPLVVFSMYMEPILELQRKFPKHVVLVNGQVVSNERQANIEKFQQGKVRIIAMTYRAGAESLNFQNADTALYHGYPWTDGMVKQAMARIYRSGQQKKTLHYFLTSGENDRRILRLVRAKEEATNEVENQLLMASGITPKDKALPSLDTFL